MKLLPDPVAAHANRAATHAGYRRIITHALGGSNGNVPPGVRLWSGSAFQPHPGDQKDFIPVSLQAKFRKFRRYWEVFPNGVQQVVPQLGELRRGYFHPVPTNGCLQPFPRDVARAPAVTAFFSEYAKHEPMFCD